MRKPGKMSSRQHRGRGGGFQERARAKPDKGEEKGGLQRGERGPNPSRWGKGLRLTDLEDVGADDEAGSNAKNGKPFMSPNKVKTQSIGEQGRGIKGRLGIKIKRPGNELHNTKRIKDLR